MYANITKRWNKEAYNVVCSTIKNLIEAVVAETPRIKKLIEDNRIGIKDFEFMKYNGCKIIP